MCIQVVERYAVCGCLYYKHAIDPCSAINTRGHSIQVKEVLVGYACNRHSTNNAGPSSGSSSTQYPDSGYASGNLDSNFRP